MRRHPARPSTALFALAVTFMTSQAVAEPIAQPPEGEAPTPSSEGARSRPNKALLVAGLVTGGIAYGAAAITSVVYLIGVYPIPALICEVGDPGTCRPQPAPLWLALPAAGPFLAAASLDADRSSRINLFKDDATTRNLFYIDGALQLTGLALIGASFLFREEVEPRNVANSSDIRLIPTPLPLPGGAFLSLTVLGLL